MNPKKLLSSTLPIIALILELLPGGVVLNFANPEGEPWRKTYSYFDLTPFGYANFGPFLTAVLTCVLVILGAVLLIKESRFAINSVRIISAAATVTSIMPLMFGVRYITVTGVIISVLLITEFCLTFKRSDERTCANSLLQKLLLGLGILFICLTFAGAGYVLFYSGKVNAGFAVIPMVFALVFVTAYRKSKEARHYALGKEVTVTVDRPLGSSHPSFPDTIYPVNYGYIKGIPSPDGEEQDAYILGVDTPCESFSGVVIAVIKRLDDVESKWVVAEKGSRYTAEDIEKALAFQEKYFNHEIIM